MLAEPVKSAGLTGIGTSVTETPEVPALAGSPIGVISTNPVPAFTMVGRHCEAINEHKIFESGQDQMVV